MSNLPTLYQLSQELVEAQTRLFELDLDDQTIADTLEGLQGALEVKATNVALMARNLESFADQIKQAEAEMSKRRRMFESRADKLRAYIKETMERPGVEISKIECPQFALTIKKNPPAVEIFDNSLVPDTFKVIPPVPEPVPDKRKIKEAIDAGAEVPGARMTRGTRLEIK